MHVSSYVIKQIAEEKKGEIWGSQGGILETSILPENGAVAFENFLPTFETNAVPPSSMVKHAALKSWGPHDKA
jgi:hypothetical protein